MIPCEVRHFSKFGDDMSKLYHSQGLSNFLCWPDNFSVSVGGKFSSDIFNYIHVSAKRCTSNCAN